MVRQQKTDKQKAGGSAGRAGGRPTEAWGFDGYTVGQADGHWVAYFREGGTGEGQGGRKRSRLGRVEPGDGTIVSPPAWVRVALKQFAQSQRALAAVAETYTIDKLWIMWLSEREKDGYSNHIYQAQWQALAPYWGHRDPKLLQADDWRTYARERFALGRKPATVHTELSRLSNCLKWAVASHLLDRRPIQWLPSKGKPRSRVLSPDEAQRLIKAARSCDPHVEPFVILLFSTGGRHTAVLDLEWTRVNFDAGPIDPETGEPRGTIDLEVDLPPDPMNKSWRKGRAHLPMSRSARAMLKRIYPTRGTCGFVIEHGNRRLQDCRGGFRSAVEKAGLGWYEDADGNRLPDGITGSRFVTDVTPHTIRHTLASWANGHVNTEFTAALLGHADSNTTRAVYTHADIETALPAVEMVDRTLNPLPTSRQLDAKTAPAAGKTPGNSSSLTQTPALIRRETAIDIGEETPE